MIVFPVFLYGALALFALLSQTSRIPGLLRHLPPSIQASFANFLPSPQPKTDPSSILAQAVFVPLAFSPQLFAPHLFEQCDPSSAPQISIRTHADVFIPLAFSPRLFEAHTFELCELSSAPQASARADADVFIPLAFSPQLFEPHMFELCELSSVPQASIKADADIFVPLAFSPQLFEPHMFELCDSSSVPQVLVRADVFVPLAFSPRLFEPHAFEQCDPSAAPQPLATRILAEALTASHSELSGTDATASLTLLASLLILGVLFGGFLTRTGRVVLDVLEETTSFLDTVVAEPCCLTPSTTKTSTLEDDSSIDLPPSSAPLLLPSVILPELEATPTLAECLEWSEVRSGSRSSAPSPTPVRRIKAAGCFDNSFAVLKEPSKRSNKKRKTKSKNTLQLASPPSQPTAPTPQDNRQDLKPSSQPAVPPPFPAQRTRNVTRLNPTPAPKARSATSTTISTPRRGPPGAASRPVAIPRAPTTKMQTIAPPVVSVLNQQKPVTALSSPAPRTSASNETKWLSRSNDSADFNSNWARRTPTKIDPISLRKAGLNSTLASPDQDANGRPSFVKVLLATLAVPVSSRRMWPLSRLQSPVSHANPPEFAFYPPPRCDRTIAQRIKLGDERNERERRILRLRQERKPIPAELRQSQRGGGTEERNIKEKALIEGSVFVFHGAVLKTSSTGVTVVGGHGMARMSNSARLLNEQQLSSRQERKRKSKSSEQKTAAVQSEEQKQPALAKLAPDHKAMDGTLFMMTAQLAMTQYERKYQQRVGIEFFGDEELSTRALLVGVGHAVRQRQEEDGERERVGA